MSAVRQLQDWMKTPAARLRADYQALFSGPTGQRVLADLMRRARIGQGSVVIESPHMTYFHEGRRDLALYIQSQLNMSDEELIRLAQRRANTDGN